ncbi:MAG: Por secretion system protein [Pedosphaera sp.]|nr:Por secretion system protein [Pedosphaera sp.]
MADQTGLGDNSTNETGFKVERAMASAGPWTLAATLGANVTCYTNGSLTASTFYYYRVYAYHTTLDNFGYSNIRSATTGNSAPVLGAIRDKTVAEGKLLTFNATATDAGLRERFIQGLKEGLKPIRTNENGVCAGQTPGGK